MTDKLLDFLKEWRTSKEIEDYFGINARTMRLYKVDFNDKYDPIERPQYILSGNRGYRVTTNTSDIRRNNKEVNLTQAVTMLKQYWKIEKNFNDIDNFKLDLWNEIE